MPKLHDSSPIVSSLSSISAPTIADIARLVPPPFAYRPAPLTCAAGEVAIYLAGSPDLAHVARRIGVGLFKLGVTSRSPRERIGQLRTDQYAGFWGTEAQRSALRGAHLWKQVAFVADSGTCTAFTHVRLHDEGHAVLSVPRSTPLTLVDAAFRATFAARSFSRFLRSEEGRQRCLQAGIDPANEFWTHYAQPEPGGAWRRAQEIFLFEPKHDGPMLLQVLDALGAHFWNTQPEVHTSLGGVHLP